MVLPFDPTISPFPVVPEVIQQGLPEPGLFPYDLIAFGQQFLFRRSWLITITSPLGATLYKDSLRTVFNIEKNSGSFPGKASVQIYGMTDMAKRITGRGVFKLSLSVGYADLILPVLFFADIQRVTNKRQGADLVTTFEIYENAFELQQFCNFSVPIGTDITVATSTLIRLMGLLPGPIIGMVPMNIGPRAFSGSAKENLEQLLELQNLVFTVQNKVVYITQKGVPVNPIAVAVSMGTGLIGSPIVSGPNGLDNILTFTSLINPRLVPGTLVAVVSKFIPKIAKIKTSTFEGDTHGSKWTVKCECVPPRIEVV